MDPVSPSTERLIGASPALEPSTTTIGRPAAPQLWFHNNSYANRGPKFLPAGLEDVRLRAMRHSSLLLAQERLLDSFAMPRKSASSAAASPRPSAKRPDDDLPEITDDMLARAELRVGERVIRRGRPPSATPKQAIKFRLDPEVLAYFRSKGPGWQTRINATLRRAAKSGA
jgi:uncharacterized protein (DUF4415 family)